MPILGIGLGLRGEICDQIVAHRKAIDFLEFTPENYRGNNATINWLDRFAERFTLVSHSVSLSIGSIDPLDRSLLTTTRSFVKQFGLQWWSDHLCFTGVDGETGNDLFPLPWTEETIKHVASRIKEAQEIVELPLILENIPFYTRMPKGDFGEAEFIARTLEEADCGMLLDLNNLHVNSINHGFDPKEFLDRIPLERVVQIHLAGPGTYGKRTIDTHGTPVPAAVFDLLDYVLSKQTQVKAVMIERDQYFPCFDELLKELNHVREIWDKHSQLNMTHASTGVAELGSDDSASRASTEDGLPTSAVAELAFLPLSRPASIRSNSKTTYVKAAGIGDIDDALNGDGAISRDTHLGPTWSARVTRASNNNSAVDESIRLVNLAQYQRRWFELWTEIKGNDPWSVDDADYKPRFARKPSSIDGFDLRALSLYAWMRDSNRDSLMRNVFPACSKIMEKDWGTILSDYFYEFRPHYQNNRHIGDRFPEFLRSHCPEYQKDYPFLYELADFELSKQAAVRSHQLTEFCGDIYLGSVEQIKECRPLVNPKLQIRSFNYPVVEISFAVLEGKSYSARILDAPLVFGILPQSWKSKVVRLSELSAILVSRARSSSTSYSQLIAACLTEQQRNSAENIAGFIQLFQTLHDEKIFIGCLPIQQAPPTWTNYYEAVADAAPHQTLLHALRLLKDDEQIPGLAIDLGCGAGRDARQLLKTGWHVFAVDSSEDALNLLSSSSNGNGWQPEQLSTYLGKMEDALLPEADLINAGVSLPFCAPQKFPLLWQNICHALKPGGRFSGHFFGMDDDWAVNEAMTFQTASQVEQLFQGFAIEWFNEFLGPVPIVPSGTRHGQIFEVVARKL
jgi:hypothetical protein